MFANKPRIETFVRVLLIAAILFNALASNTVTVQAEPESASTSPGKLESRSIPAFPTFERPEARATECNDLDSSERASANTNHSERFLQKNGLDSDLSPRASVANDPSCPPILTLLGQVGYPEGWPHNQRQTTLDDAHCYQVSASTIYCFGQYAGFQESSPQLDSSYSHEIRFTVPDWTLMYFEWTMSGTYFNPHCGMFSTLQYGCAPVNSGSFSKYVTYDHSNGGYGRFIVVEETDWNSHMSASYFWTVRISTVLEQIPLWFTTKLG